MAKEATTKSYPSAIAVERAVDVLSYLAEHGEATVTDLSRALGSGTTAIHRILTALRRKGLVDQEPLTERYRLAWGIVALARPVRGEAGLRDVARPAMQRLLELTEETITLGVKSGNERLCVEQIEGPHEVRWVGSVGQWSPLYAGATGRAILAGMLDVEIDEYLDGVNRYSFTTRTLTDRTALRADVEATRRAGFSLADSDRIEGLVGISAPVFDRSGHVIAAMTIGVPANRAPTDPRAWGVPLAEAAAKVSQVLGYVGAGLEGLRAGGGE